MNMKRLKDVAMGALIATMVLGTATVGFAKVGQANIPVSYQNIKIKVDGKTISTDKEPFTYEGVTYLPVRVVAEAVGMDLGWDDATKTVSLNKKGTTPTVTPSAPVSEVSKSVTYSRNAPAPINTAQKIVIDEKYGDNWTGSITITESYRGSSAWNKIKAENQFNEEAPEGKEYVLFKVNATVDTVKDDKAVNFNTHSFKPFSSSNVEYEITSVVKPKPVFDGSVYSGGTLEGYVAFLVDKSDIAPKVVIGSNYDGSGGFWFNITK